jgi:uncharacterized repeat protein (TIGR01451 family)
LLDRLGQVLRAWLILALLLAPVTPARADLRTGPVWWDENAVGAAGDWHYRVAINVPSGATVNSTIKVDVDFNALLATMGVSGTFDVDSPRVIRANGTIATTQEFTDSVYAGATDATGNSRGEVRFLLQDAGATTYYLYFDITQNGTKSANPQTPINGNFEKGGSGTALPPGWSAQSKVEATLDSEIRPSETPTITSDGTSLINSPRTTDGNPNTGAFSYLMGARTANEVATGQNRTTLQRTITVPATNPGNLALRWRPEGWDSNVNGSNSYDYIRIQIIGTTTTEVVGPTYGNFNTTPFSPNYGTNTASTSTYGYRHYNGFDMTTGGTHMLGMTVGYAAEPWWSRSVSLAAFAGQTVTLRITTSHTVLYKSWFHIDDVEWSVVAATLGTPQAFGANINSPATGGTMAPGQVLATTVQVDATPTSSLIARIFDNGGASLGTDFVLYNDGTHGDAVAGDALWTNDGSVPANPAPTVPLSAPTSGGWVLRIYAKDGSTSSIGAQNGLVRGPGSGSATETQANYYNIDEISFSVQRAIITVAKTSSVLSDPVNGVTNPKMIPGATVSYCILVSNAGPATATTVIATDTLPAETSFVSGSMRSGTTCAGAATVEDDNNSGADESDPFGASYSAGTIIMLTSSLASGAAMALIFSTIIQ